MTHFSAVGAVSFLPLVGALFLLFIRGDERVTAMNSRRVALLTSGTAFLGALIVFAHFKNGVSGVQFEYKTQWLPVFGVGWHTGLDAFSLIFFVLFSGTAFVSILSARTAVLSMVREYMFLTLVSESFLLTAVCSRNLLQCFIFYEAATFPVFVMIAVWGVEKRAFTAFKFCFYDLAGSLVLMGVLLYAFVETGNSDLGGFKASEPSMHIQTLLLAGLTVMLALKAPLFPFHVWFAETRSESPVPTAIVLSGVLSKAAFFVFFRTAAEVAPDALVAYGEYLGLWAVFGAVYGALIAAAQDDLKTASGYAHLSQTAVLAAGMFSLTETGMTGALFLCVVQTAAAAFYAVAAGALELRLDAKELKNCTGLYSDAPALGGVLFLSALCVAAFPPAPVFTGEFFIFAQIFADNKVAGIASVLSMVLIFSAFLPLLSRSVLGENDGKSPKPADLSIREKGVLYSLAAFCAFEALFPNATLHSAREGARLLLSILTGE